MAAIKISEQSFVYASDDLKADKEVALLAVSGRGININYVSDQLKNDKEIVIAAIKNNKIALDLAGDIQYDPEFLKEIEDLL